MSKRVVVIGGGLGALSGAVRLAKLGFDVTLFEKNDCLGGKMGELVLGNYRFDTGPSLLTMDFVIDEFFNFVGFERSKFIELVPIDPICKYFFSDGSTLDTSSNVQKMIASIRSLSPDDAERYPNYLSYCKQIYDLTADIFLFTPIHEIRKLLKRGDPKILLNLHKIDPFRSFHQAVSSFFSDPRLVQLFDRYTTYNGSEPFRAPATLNIISYVEHGLGVYYIKGGMYRLVQAISSLAERLGVRIYLSTEVQKILWNDGKVNGVLVNGETIPTDYVLCGADVVVAHNHLIDGLKRRRKRLNKLEPSLSGLTFLWGVSKKNSQLLQHNIFFSSDYKKEFRQIFTERDVPEDPTIYVAITSKTDPEHAPQYGENWFVLLNMPYVSGGHDHEFWHDRVKRVRDVVIKKLSRYGFDISNSIEEESVMTPLDFMSKFSSNAGSIYGISSNSLFTAFLRQPNRSREIKGLYFASGSAHPGGGIPLVMLSGKMSAELIYEDAQRSV